MSNYINVLRRLERERRLPEVPPPPAIAPKVLEIPPQVPAVQVAAVPAIATPTAAPTPAPAPIAVPENTLQVPVPTPRTVIPLQSVVPAAAPIPTTPPIAPDALPVVEPAIAKQDSRRSRAFATEAHPGIATLLDNIRMLASGRASRTVVFCGASTTQAVASLADALATHAIRSGLRAFVGTLDRTTTGTVIAAASGSSTRTTRPLEVDLDAGTPTAELQRWVEQVAPSCDLTVITGPPLATSIDAALLACACDGLVIVAESEVTERAALQVAAERARIAGCRTLGVVMHGTKDRLPGWIRRLVGDRSEPHLD